MVSESLHSVGGNTAVAWQVEGCAEKVPFGVTFENVLSFDDSVEGAVLDSELLDDPVVRGLRRATPLCDDAKTRCRGMRWRIYSIDIYMLFTKL